MSADMADTSVLHTTSKQSIPGMLDSTLTGDGLFDGSALAIDVLLQAILGSVTKSIVSYFVQTEALGSVCYGMSADTTTHDVESATDDVAKVMTEFQQSGSAGERCLVHKVTGAVSAGADGTSINNLADTLFGGVAYLQVLAQSGGGTLTVKVQHSDDNAVWVDLITFAGTTVIGAQRLAVAGTVEQYTRASHAITAGSATYTMAFGRKTY
jgi:hypothetical protein